MTVAAILKTKGNDIVSVRPSTLVTDVATLLSHRRIGAVLVLDDTDHLVGIVSERDVVHSLAAHGAAALDMMAAHLMTRVVHTVSPGTTVEQAMATMTTGRVRHLPVLDGRALAGIVSIGDVVKARLDQQAQEVDSLRAYVSGG